MIDEKYFEIERWPLSSGDAPAGLTAGTGAAQMLFVASGSVSVSSDAGGAFPVGRCELAVIPALASDVRVGVESPAEIIRILPKAV